MKMKKAEKYQTAQRKVIETLEDAVCRDKGRAAFVEVLVDILRVLYVEGDAEDLAGVRPQINLGKEWSADTASDVASIFEAHGILENLRGGKE